MAELNRFFPANAFRICIDNIELDISGRIYSPLSSEPIPFVSMSEIFVKMDELFDKCGYPQAFQDKRSFDEGKEIKNGYRGLPRIWRETENILTQCGRKRTFDVIVKSRQNTSWQGNLYDGDGNCAADFNGEVELLSSMIKLNEMA